MIHSQTSASYIDHYLEIDNGGKTINKILRQA